MKAEAAVGKLPLTAAHILEVRDADDFELATGFFRKLCDQALAAIEMHKRYQWAANELLVCDYGDNEQQGNVIGWSVYGWRRNSDRRIYGPSIDAAIDAEIAKAAS